MNKGGGKMGMKKVCVVWIIGCMMFFLLSGIALANKSEASIEAPAEAPKGSEFTIKITVTHNANNFLHYTESLKVTAGDKEIGRWIFTRFQRPEGAVFTREIKIKVIEDVEIKAEASCNIHGSKGPATVKITAKE
jgi:desulfoferrodoxin (superoxide reductase-like protein)